MENFGSFTIVPPDLANDLYRDVAAEEVTVQGDRIIQAVEQLMQVVEESASSVEPILSRNGTGGSSSGGGGGLEASSVGSSTPPRVRDVPGVLLPMSDSGVGAGPATKRARYTIQLTVLVCLCMFGIYFRVEERQDKVL